MTLTELVYCVIVAFIITERADQRICINAPAHSTALVQAFVKASRHSGLSAPLQNRLGFLRLLVFPKAKIAVESVEVCECDGHTVRKLSQWGLTADWLAPRESDFSWMRSKVSPCDFWFFQKLKSPLKVWRFVNATVTQYVSSVNGVSLPTD